MNRSTLSGPFIPAAALILLGALFLLNNLNVMDASEFIGTFWPVILILLGLWWVVGAGPTFMGVVFIVLGAVFIGEQLGLPGIGSLWPLVLIAVGLWILVQQRRGVPSASVSSAGVKTGDTLDVKVVFGEAKPVVTSTNFRGGRASATFGSAELDLRDARLAAEGATLEASATLGEVKVLVPRDWAVQLNGTPSLGEIEDKRRSSPAAEGPTLVVNATVTLGSVEIKD